MTSFLIHIEYIDYIPVRVAFYLVVVVLLSWFAFLYSIAIEFVDTTVLNLMCALVSLSQLYLIKF